MAYNPDFIEKIDWQRWEHEVSIDITMEMMNNYPVTLQELELLGSFWLDEPFNDGAELEMY